VQEGGLSALPGSGERDTDGEELHEELDLSSFSPRLRARFEKQAEEDVKLTRDQKESLNALFPENRVLFDRCMSEELAIGIGGAAEAFLTANDMSELKKIVGWCGEMTVDYRFIGSGTKTIVRDGGLKGVLVRPGSEFDFINLLTEGEEGSVLEIGAATGVRKFIGWCVEKGFTGAEGLLEAGGSVAGCVMTAAKLAEGSVADIIEEITIVNKDMRELTLKGKSLRFESSGLKIPRTAVITRVVFKLTKGDVGEIAKTIDAIEKKNSEISSGNMKYMSRVFQDQERMKASDMIDDASLRGIRVGKARVSTVDGNVIINEGDAKPKDVMVLMSLIRDTVKHETGIVLEPVISVIGDRN
jgi:UDP-N-acetylmuramate dehydrogenase